MINPTVLLENETKTYTAYEVTMKINDKGINVLGFYDHRKASEKYVVIWCNGREWVIPYSYRRTNLFIDSIDELVELIKRYKDNLSTEYIELYKKDIGSQIAEIFGENADVTIPIFEELLNNCGEWVSNKGFNSPNTQRRIQDIKEHGFTLATKTEGRKATYHMLLPFERCTPSGYETFSTRVRNEIFKVHNGINAFTGAEGNISCLPDHKFPEIRWNADTPVSNENLTQQEMLKKFQIVPERINQMKREVCRKCFQTGKRGTLNGINFFYEGDKTWNTSIPKTGKEAEVGCVGCFWYDMIAWRKALNSLIEESK